MSYNDAKNTQFNEVQYPLSNPVIRHHHRHIHLPSTDIQNIAENSGNAVVNEFCIILLLL